MWYHFDINSVPLLSLYDWETFSQYTGLKDKNGKEIYGGDILNYHINKIDPPTDEVKKLLSQLDGAVIHHSLWYGTEERDERRSVKIPEIYHWDDVDDWEIIGNIYENPELIK